MHFVKSYELDLMKFKTGDNLSELERYTVTLFARAGNVISTYFTPEGQLMVNIEHRAIHTHDVNLVYTFLLVPPNVRLDLSHCRFVNTAVDMRFRQDKRYINSLFHVYIKDEVSYTR